jgi:hypothetical protein
MKFNIVGNAVLIVLCLAPLSVAQVSVAQTQQKSNEDQEWEKLLEDNSEAKALQVNEGELEFLKTPPKDKAVHTVTNTITISDASLETQWVTLHQCHKNLDAVAASEIVYQYEQMRNLRVEHYYGIDKAWVENQTVQMTDIERGLPCALWLMCES